MMRKIREQRRDIRFPEKYPVKMVVDTRVAYQGVTRDISQSGAFIITKGPFRIGQKLVLDFRSTRLSYKKKSAIS